LPDRRLADRKDQLRFPSAGIAEGQHVLPAVHHPLEIVIPLCEFSGKISWEEVSRIKKSRFAEEQIAFALRQAGEIDEAAHRRIVHDEGHSLYSPTTIGRNPLGHFCVTYLHYSMHTMQTVGTVQTAPFLCKLLII